MTIVSGGPGADEVGAAGEALREWRDDGAPARSRPGDLGWFHRFDAEATAAVRTRSRDGRILAVGLLDGRRLSRPAIAPEAARDEEPARRPVGDVSDPGCGVLPEGRASTPAAAVAPREMGSSSVFVCTPSADVGGVATCVPAGFRALPEVRDRTRGDG
ncbi:hypothetical protein [Streptomyces sp. ST2-7A]|uniref:hypothetical protein n=1 Tax=Streptomyces sp. ST2-7A TaxID=2907214 RepID=UPI001F41FEBE|nr:hypothetical protein [Streptomyces sp. ST2-7A]MCE7082064.1 hypothetical protein [Streptomyces sp. ST2-7A]